MPTTNVGVAPWWAAPARGQDFLPSGACCGGRTGDGTGWEWELFPGAHPTTLPRHRPDRRQRRYRRAVSRGRTGRNASRSVWANNSGSAAAGKCPPWSRR
jgi:hypothetical protein